MKTLTLAALVAPTSAAIVGSKAFGCFDTTKCGAYTGSDFTALNAATSNCNFGAFRVTGSDAQWANCPQGIDVTTMYNNVRKDLLDWGPHQTLVKDRNGKDVIRVSRNGYELTGNAEGYACLRPDGKENWDYIYNPDGTIKKDANGFDSIKKDARGFAIKRRADEHCIFNHNFCTNYGGNGYKTYQNPGGHGQCGMKLSEVEQKCGKWAACAGVICVKDNQRADGTYAIDHTAGNGQPDHPPITSQNVVCFARSKADLNYRSYKAQVVAVDKGLYGLFNMRRPQKQHYGKCRGNYFAAGAGAGPCFKYRNGAINPGQGGYLANGSWVSPSGGNGALYNTWPTGNQQGAHTPNAFMNTLHPFCDYHISSGVQGLYGPNPHGQSTRDEVVAGQWDLSQNGLKMSQICPECEQCTCDDAERDIAPQFPFTTSSTRSRYRSGSDPIGSYSLPTWITMVGAKYANPHSKTKCKGNMLQWPTPSPTASPTEKVTAMPTDAPTESPTESPTQGFTNYCTDVYKIDCPMKTHRPMWWSKRQDLCPPKDITARRTKFDCCCELRPTYGLPTPIFPNPPVLPIKPTFQPTSAPTICDPDNCMNWECEGKESWCTCFKEGVSYPKCADDGDACQCQPKSCAMSWTCPKGWGDKTDLGNMMVDIPCPNDVCSNEVCCNPPPTPSPTDSPTESPTAAPTNWYHGAIPQVVSCGNLLFMDVRNNRNKIVKGKTCKHSGAISGANAIPDCRTLRQNSPGAKPVATATQYRYYSASNSVCHFNGNLRGRGSSCSGRRVCQLGSFANHTGYAKCRAGDFTPGRGGQPGNMKADTTCRAYQSYDTKLLPIKMYCDKGVYTFHSFTPHGWYPGNRPAHVQGEEFISMDMTKGVCV